MISMNSEIRKEQIKKISDNLTADYLKQGYISISDILGAPDAMCMGWGYPVKHPCTTKMPCINKVIFNPPATIIIWNDGTKTICKVGLDDTYDPEVGFAMCIAKKYMGSRHQIEKQCEKYYEENSYEINDPFDFLFERPKRIKEKLKKLNDMLKKMEAENAGNKTEENI